MSWTVRRGGRGTGHIVDLRAAVCCGLGTVGSIGPCCGCGAGGRTVCGCGAGLGGRPVNTARLTVPRQTVQITGSGCCCVSRASDGAALGPEPERVCGGLKMASVAACVPEFFPAALFRAVYRRFPPFATASPLGGPRTITTCLMLTGLRKALGGLNSHDVWGHGPTGADGSPRALISTPCHLSSGWSSASVFKTGLGTDL